MVKVEVKRKDGTHIVLEGTESEVKKLLSLLSEAKETPRVKSKDNHGKMSIGDLLTELKSEGLFDKPRSLVEIKNALAEKGRIYELTTLSTQVIRQVRKHNLGRIKREKKWMYVRR